MPADKTRMVVDIEDNEEIKLALKECDTGADPNYSQIVYVQNAGDIGGGGGALAATNVFGEIASLAASSTGTVASVGSTSADYRFAGFIATADGNARVWVEIAGSPVLEGRISSAQKTLHLPLPNGVDTSTGVAVELKAENCQTGRTIRVTGTLLGTG